MTNRSAVKWVVAVVMSLFGYAAGCKSQEPPAPPLSPQQSTSGAPGESSGGVSSEQVRLMTVLRDYQLPAQSSPPARHADPQVNSVLQKMMSVANQQGLVFDGSRAAEGIVVVGQPGKSGKPMLVAVAVYPKAGRVAMQDTMSSNGFDYRDAGRMKERYLNAL